jgi:hypothetical protein
MTTEKRPMPARCVQKAAQDQRPDAYWSIVSDLVALIERTRGYQLVNEAVEPSSADDGEVVVLDDVAPEQASEVTLLSDCNLRLREALHFLLEARASRKQRARPVASPIESGDPAREAVGELISQGAA